MDYENDREYGFVRSLDGHIERATFIRWDDSAFVNTDTEGCIFEYCDEVWRQAITWLESRGFRDERLE
jgi:hypothetical protein